MLFTVFTKPWTIDIPTLARHVSDLGFDGIELPVRPGYPVHPGNVEEALRDAARIMNEHGLRIASIAGPTDERTIAACAAAGVPIIRICVSVAPDENFLDAESRLRREYDELTPILDRYGVALGIQNHCGRGIANAANLRSLLHGFDPRHVAAVWDAAHNALQGEEPEQALDTVWPHLRMVNLKNAYWRRTNGPEAEVAEWRPYWTTGRHGLASWPRVLAYLRRRNWQGTVCLTAEYTDGSRVDALAAQDLAFVRALQAAAG